MTLVLLGGTAVATAVIVPDSAYAGKGNGNGGGNGGGNGNSAGKGNSGGDTVGKGSAFGRENAATRSGNVSSSKTIRSLRDIFRGRSGEAKTRKTTRRAATTRVTRSRGVTARAPETTAAPAPKPGGNPLWRELGVHPSELGALNAAHASPTALANASPNSRVGKLAIYMGEVEAGRELQAELDEALAILAELDEPTRSIEDIDAALATASGEKQALEDELAALNEALAAAGGSDPDIEADIGTVTDALAEKDAEIDGLEQERADGEAYADAADKVERLEGELETQQADQRAALEDAANKEVTDDIEIAVQKLLGIYTQSAEEPLDDEEIAEGTGLAAID